MKSSVSCIVCLMYLTGFISTSGMCCSLSLSCCTPALTVFSVYASLSRRSLTASRRCCSCCRSRSQSCSICWPLNNQTYSQKRVTLCYYSVTITEHVKWYHRTIQPTMSALTLRVQFFESISYPEAQSAVYSSLYSAEAAFSHFLPSSSPNVPVFLPER